MELDFKLGKVDLTFSLLLLCRSLLANDWLLGGGGGWRIEPRLSVPFTSVFEEKDWVAVGQRELVGTEWNPLKAAGVEAEPFLVRIWD